MEKGKLAPSATATIATVVSGTKFEAATTEMRNAKLCSGCQRITLHFSKKQSRKPDHSRRCIRCVANDTSGKPHGSGAKPFASSVKVGVDLEI